MRASRLLAILLTLQSRDRVSASALAERFEVSARTIYRDIDALSAAGVPIYADPGRNGGISLHAGYRTRLTGLTEAEAAALPLASLSHAARDLGVATPAASALLKVLASLPPASGDLAQRMAERFHIDPIPWYHRAETLARLPTLAEAVWRDRRIEIGYDSWKGTVRRRLDPLGLAQKGGDWYLVAAWRGAARTYRVSNIQALTLLDEAAKRPDRFDLPRYWARWVQDFEARLMGGRARVRISREGLQILRATLPAAAAMAAETQNPCDPPGWVEATLPIEDEAYAARQILRLGTEIVVLAPSSLAATVRAEAAAVAALYPRGSKRGAQQRP